MRRLAPLCLVPFALAACQRSDAPADGAATAAHDHSDSLRREHAGDSTQASAAVQPPRVPVAGREVAYADGVRGYLAVPRDSGSTPLPAIVVVHEWWGLNDNVRRMTDRLAGEGYRALAVDLYGGRVAETPDSAMAIMQAATATPQNLATNVRAAYTYLAQTGRAPKIGILGWCFGGGMAAQSAVAMPLQLDAAVIYYGQVGEITEAQIRPLGMPVLGFFGGQDSSIPVASVRAFEGRLKAANKDAEIVIYPDAGHAFANPTGDNYQAGPAQDAWTKTTAFLARTLK